MAGGEARIVGGAVRDALLGRAVHEIDFASSLPPEVVSAALVKAGYKAVPTGIEFGTITAVIDGKGYEITTLRHDVETDGRHAVVAYTDDWQADAARRDFTMNALYLDAQGKLYDYCNGQKDTEQGRVRFIGKAEERIREDVLRILRFFRFFAWFGKGEADAEGLAACRDLAHLVPQLSVERVWREIGKLLAAPEPAVAWRLIVEHKILVGVLLEASDVTRLQFLVTVEKQNKFDASSLRRLAALVPPQAADSIVERLKLSKREAKKLAALCVLPTQLQGKLDVRSLRRALYDFGVEDCMDAVLLIAAAHPPTDIKSALATIAAWESPVFPLQGQDLLQLGMKPGPEVGNLLRTIEQAWIDSDFRLTRDDLLQQAKAIVGSK